MKRRSAILLLLSVSLYGAEFEAASVKSAAPGQRGTVANTLAGRLTVRDTTLRFLIRMAYDLKDFQISGGPSWLDTERFDVEATTGGGATEQHSREMLQTLLADRFQLRIRYETKELPVYFLVAAKTGVKLLESKAPEKRRGMTGWSDQIKATGASTAQLAGQLSSVLERTVVDKTGMTGLYDYAVNWVPLESQAPATDGGAPTSPSLFTALQETMGLRLDPGKAPVEVLVVDRAEKPSAN